MGCCLSATAVPKSNNLDSRKSQLTTGRTAPPSLSPPQVIEEETVKEVLTETPIPKPPTPALIDTQPTKQPPQIQLNKKIEPAAVATKQAAETFSEVSEVSELCSYTESYSTTALTEKKDGEDDDDGEVTQRVNRIPAAKVARKRQYAGEHLRGKERGAVNSPARRQLPSPEKKGPLPSRSVPGRNATANRRNAGPTNVVRRDTAEGSGRRSRSPATRGGEMGQRRNIRHRSPSLTKTDRSGGPSAEQKVENDGGGGGGGGKKLDKAAADDGAGPVPRESLDNPLVSLECFIFL